MKQGTKSPYDEPLSHQCHVKLTDTLHYYVKAKALLDGKDKQDIVRLCIERMRQEELKSGIDVVKIAKDYCLI